MLINQKEKAAREDPQNNGTILFCNTHNRAQRA
jgi:hypothetical protein